MTFLKDVKAMADLARDWPVLLGTTFLVPLKGNLSIFYFQLFNFIPLAEGFIPSIPPLLLFPFLLNMEKGQQRQQNMWLHSFTITKCIGRVIVWTLSTFGHYDLSER